MESTLASVLQNRPAASEVVVLLPSAYSDPYGLGEEVRFVVVPEARDLATLLTAALKTIEGTVLHVLSAGAEVAEDWTVGPLERFWDARIAAVAPLVVLSQQESIVASVGVDYSVGGTRRVVGSGEEVVEHLVEDDVLGPTLIAGFYRIDALRQLAAPFEPAVGDRRLDVDTALQLQAAGYRAVYDPRSVVYRESARLGETSPFAAGRQCERLFLRHVPQRGRLRSLVAHLPTLLGGLFGKGAVKEKLARGLGRLTATLELLRYRKFRRDQLALGRPGLSFGRTSTGDRFRIDTAHSRRATSAPSRLPADQRPDGDAMA